MHRWFCNVIKATPLQERSHVAKITGYYNRYRPHQHNGGLSPLATEAEYKKIYNELASFS